MKLNDPQKLYARKKNSHIFSKFSKEQMIKLTKKFRLKFTEGIK